MRKTGMKEIVQSPSGLIESIKNTIKHADRIGCAPFRQRLPLCHYLLRLPFELADSAMRPFTNLSCSEWHICLHLLNVAIDVIEPECWSSFQFLRTWRKKIIILQNYICLFAPTNRGEETHCRFDIRNFLHRLSMIPFSGISTTYIGPMHWQIYSREDGHWNEMQCPS